MVIIGGVEVVGTEEIFSSCLNSSPQIVQLVVSSYTSQAPYTHSVKPSDFTL